VSNPYDWLYAFYWVVISACFWQCKFARTVGEKNISAIEAINVSQNCYSISPGSDGFIQRINCRHSAHRVV